MKTKRLNLLVLASYLLWLKSKKTEKQKITENGSLKNTSENQGQNLIFMVAHMTYPNFLFGLVKFEVAYVTK